MCFSGCAKSGLQLAHSRHREPPSQHGLCIRPQLVDCWLPYSADSFKPAQRFPFSLVSILSSGMCRAYTKAVAESSVRRQTHFTTEPLVLNSSERAAEAWKTTEQFLDGCCRPQYPPTIEASSAIGSARFRWNWQKVNGQGSLISKKGCVAQGKQCRDFKMLFQVGVADWSSHVSAV